MYEAVWLRKFVLTKRKYVNLLAYIVLWCYFTMLVILDPIVLGDDIPACVYFPKHSVLHLKHYHFSNVDIITHSYMNILFVLNTFNSTMLCSCIICQEANV